MAAVRELYLRYGGNQHRRIAAEIRAAGWPTFDRRVFGARLSDGRRQPGWAERLGWDKELKRRARKAEAKRAERARASSSFEAWLTKASPGMDWTAKHHAFICEQLRRVTSGEVRRLMLFMPPRHGKSELVTVRYALWRLRCDPKMNVIIGCYNQKLANRFSRKISRLAEGSVQLSRRKSSAEEWETAAGGGVKAVGVGAGITGFGGDLVIVDDPVKGREAANSRIARDKIWDWYRDDLHTRLEPGAAIILIQTRWHDDDLAGRLLKDMQNGGEQWEVVRLPALAEPSEMRNEEPLKIPHSAFRVPHSSDPLGRSEGEALWPGRFGRDELLAIERRLGAWSFAALYQQRPVPRGGTLFKPEWFRSTVAKCPEGLRWARGYDLAVSLKDSADYTASFRCAIDQKTGILYIADGCRMRAEYPEQRQFVIERMIAEPDTAHGIELALHGKALIQDLCREPTIRGRNLRGIKVDVDKLMRAEAWAALAAEGKIVLVNGPWVNDFVDEACRFTGRGDAHDDQVDAVSLAVQMLRSKTREGHSF